MKPSTPSPRKVRDQHSDLIRESILSAARRLFLQRGYSGTGMRDLAEEAGVAVQTIYSTFGAKSRVLLALLEAVAKDDEASRARQAIATANDPDDLAAAIARMHRYFFEHYGDIMRIVRVGAATDTDVSAAHEEGVRMRRRGLQMACRRLIDIGVLSQRDLDYVALHVEALVLPEVYDLASEQGWSPDQYEKWLGDCLMGLFRQERGSLSAGPPEP